MDYPLHKTEAQWKKELGPEKYQILRQKGTERPHTGTYNLHFEKGTYCCAACAEPLFASDSKFDAHCGWPSFDAALPNKVKTVLDKSHGMLRTEIVCTNCGGHLGHVFEDGPTKTKQRYCVNSLSVAFTQKQNP
ncbi:peptide-methionine (R)-S-oxide reductase MsrB [Flavobacterium crassostreae]|uniref:peptide-methionine (R)-S-oxide reductase n=1 Tax=Flavobacterium crassostreae TaxID=1763534 RepID=A0A1B9DYN7_9FLAO|nr:peptide-methionine (R)-S-oxide reductase MsrB [Flavobacterium crassostreae]OCB74813.1 peptide-methionine (R)-S-oxide reductase [Flavobacterium crassostreae]